MGEAATIEGKDIDKVGRPCKYSTHVEPRLAEVEEWIKEGLTDYCIADNLGISYISLIRYKKEFDNLVSVYTRAQVKQVQKVVNSTFKRANGYDYEEKTVEAFPIKDENGIVTDYELKPTKVITKHVPGDVNAQKFYLINRDPENWHPDNRVETGSIVINNFQLPQLEQDLAQIAEKRKALEALLHTDYEVISEPE